MGIWEAGRLPRVSGYLTECDTGRAGRLYHLQALQLLQFIFIHSQLRPFPAVNRTCIAIRTNPDCFPWQRISDMLTQLGYFSLPLPTQHIACAPSGAEEAQPAPLNNLPTPTTCEATPGTSGTT
jgi:hypothetical protein